jgi:transglutaminase-like putative cysteine protease
MIKRMVNSIANWRLQEGSFSLLLLALMLFSVTWSVQAAEWVPDGLWILSPVTLVGMLTGLVLAKLHDVPRYLLHILGSLIGILFIFYQMSTIMDNSIGNWQDKARELLVRVHLWYVAASTGQSNADTLLFVFVLAAMCWLLAYTSAWFVFRSHWAWWAVAPNAVAILVNISYALHTENLTLYFLLFVFSALLLLARFNLFQHEQKWDRERVNYSPTIIWRFLRSSATFCLIITLAFWFIPNSSGVNYGVASWVSSWNQPWEAFNDNISRWFAGVSSNRGGNYSYSSFGDSFMMGGKLNLSQNVALVIREAQPNYIEARAYDSYDGRSWDGKSAAATFKAEGAHANRSSELSLAAGEQMRNDDLMRNPITETITIVSHSGKLVFGTYVPVSATIPTLLDVSWVQADEDVAISAADSRQHPVAVRNLIDLLRQGQQQMRTNGSAPDNLSDTGAVVGLLDNVLTPGEGKSLGPAVQHEINTLGNDGVQVALHIQNRELYLHYSGELAIQDDLMGVQTTQDLNTGDSYSVVVRTSNADETSLRNAGANYPQWVKARYLPLPNSVTERTRNLAAQIVANAAKNPYDEAKAIEQYLKNNFTYSTDIPLPPPNRDRVDYFLFDGKQGYCEDYSAAAVVLLRALNIPTREVTGFAPGTYDSTQGAYVYREANSHAWPEVYFPGYGWIQFEPTPGFSGQTRPSTPQTPTPVPDTSPTPSAATPTPNPHDPNVPTPVPPVANTGTPGEPPDSPAAVVAKWGLLILMLLGLLFAWLWSREGKRLYEGSKYYEKLVRWAGWAGVGPAPHQTPYEYAEQLDQKLPGARGLFRPIASAYVRERFGKQKADGHERESLTRYWMAARSAIARRIPFRWLGRQ